MTMGNKGNVLLVLALLGVQLVLGLSLSPALSDVSGAAAAAAAAAAGPGATVRPSFTIGDDNAFFSRDGKPFRLLSGSFHYFRCHPALWRDRLERLKALGLNAVQFYIPWNVHEPEMGQFEFTGVADVERFLDLAAELGLVAVVRAGPYSCGEWEFGGFPYWLLTRYPDVQLRTHDPLFVTPVMRWFDQLLPRLRPRLYSNGGNVVMVQVENEYGSYGADHQYLGLLRDKYLSVFGEGAVVIHSTDGGPELANTVEPGIFQTIDFGPTSDPASQLATLRKTQKTGPFMNSEYYTGWLTHWRDEHMAHTTAATVAGDLDLLLALNASVNLYMAYGGSNFGFLNGANGGGGSIQPVVTSYDYDSPISEWGDLTDKFFALRKVFTKYGNAGTSPPPPPPANPAKTAYGAISLVERAALFADDNARRVTRDQRTVAANSTLTMEALAQNYGFLLYVFETPLAVGQYNLTFPQLHDRVAVLVDGAQQGVASRGEDAGASVSFTVTGGRQLSLLLENQGRINYGHDMKDFKGLLGGVQNHAVPLNGTWRHHVMTMTAEELARLRFRPVGGQGGARPAATAAGAAASVAPTFYRGVLEIPADTPVTDTFLQLGDGFTKGFVVVNNFNLGRFWSLGPQLALYVPAPLLRAGSNEVLVFDIHGRDSGAAPQVTFRDTPDLRR